MTDPFAKKELFRFEGPVVPGDGRGRRMGFPTLNVATDVSGVKPGVYAGYLAYDALRGLHGGLQNASQDFPALIHVGPRPTVGDSKSRLEVYLLSFPDGAVFDRIEVYGVGFIRGIFKFDSVDALSLRLQRDKVVANERFFSSG